jgi:hypothetical protein
VAVELNYLSGSTAGSERNRQDTGNQSAHQRDDHRGGGHTTRRLSSPVAASDPSVRSPRKSVIQNQNCRRITPQQARVSSGNRWSMLPFLTYRCCEGRRTTLFPIAFITAPARGSDKTAAQRRRDTPLGTRCDTADIFRIHVSNLVSAFARAPTPTSTMRARRTRSGAVNRLR